MTLRDQFNEAGLKLRKTQGDFGLELELETTSVENYPRNFWDGYDGNYGGYNANKLPSWKIVEDGSLRNFGREFVSVNPLDIDPLFASIDEFAAATKGTKFIENAPNASTHLHINFAKRPPKELASFITVYLLLENLLARWAGPSRWSNFFALTCRDAQAYPKHLGQIVSDIGRGQTTQVNASYTKYSALNFCRLYDLGSLEVRLLRSTANPSVLKDWVWIFNEILKFSAQDIHPREWMNLVMSSQDGTDKLLREVFNGNSKILTQDIEENEVRHMVEATVFSCWRYLKFVQNWDEMNEAFTLRKQAFVEEHHENYSGRNIPMDPDPQPRHRRRDVDIEQYIDRFVDTHAVRVTNTTPPPPRRRRIQPIPQPGFEPEPFAVPPTDWTIIDEFTTVAQSIAQHIEGENND